MKRIIACLVISSFIAISYGQTFFFGRPAEQKLEFINLDKASVRCYYQFVQKDKSDQLQTDTMTLDIGVQMSEYYDITRDSPLAKYFSKINPSTIQHIEVFKEQDAFEQESAGGT